jgi:hypothetical protein
MLNKCSKNLLSVSLLTALSVSSSAPLALGLGMTQNPAPKVLNVASPGDGSVWSRPDGCLAPVVDVKGKTSMEEAQPLDLVLIIDRSGSTQKIVDGTDTVLDIERKAGKALIELLETAGDVHRLGLVSFARTVSEDASLGSAWDELHTALAGLSNSEGATYPALAIESALRALENKRPEAQPGIILITDGIPTLCKPDDGSSILDPNGIPQECSKATDKDGGTQERDDRLVTLEAARLAKAAGVPIYPVIIEPENKIDRKLTTMPAVHDITGAAGQVPRLNKNNLAQLSYVVTHLPIMGVTQVDTTNLDATESVMPNVLGEFEAKVFVGTGDNDLRISAHTGDPANAKHVNLTINVAEDAAAGINVQIINGNDDVEERLSNGSMYMDSSDLELVKDGNTEQNIGLRFQNVDIPQGATITAAYIEFETDEKSSGATSLTFHGEAADNAAPFVAQKNNLTSRALTSAAVDWNNIPAWNIVNQKHQSPDLSPIVQEIVNRGGWTAQNSMVFVISGTGKRVAESYNGERNAAPVLHVEIEGDGPQQLACSGVAPEPPCKIYSIHDQGSADTYFLVMTPLSGKVDRLGPAYKGADIEGMDISPDGRLLAVAGHSNRSVLYEVNAITGDIVEIGEIETANGSTSFRNIVSLSFRSDGTLWGAATQGIVKINPNTAKATLEYSGSVSAGGIAWTLDNSQLWIVNGKTLKFWTEGGNVSSTGITLPESAEGLEFRPDGKLMVGVHSSREMIIYAVDISDGSVVVQDSFDGTVKDDNGNDMALNDIEAMAWPESCGDVPTN